jgi:endonuclease/exonuclease/phosphatase family metal-dependent hydrolase
MEQKFIRLTDSPTPSPKLRIMSLNFLADMFCDYEVVEPQHKDWIARLQKFQDMLVRWSPDVIALQEIDRVEDVAQILEKSGYQVCVPSSNSNKKKKKVSLMMGVKTDIPAVMHAEKINPLASNGATKIIIAEIKDIKIINVHLKARYSCEDVRLAQLEIISAFFGPRCVVVGDFNAERHSSTWNFLCNHEFTSAYPPLENTVSFSCRRADLSKVEGWFDHIFYKDLPLHSFFSLPLISEIPEKGLPHLDFSSSDHMMIGAEFGIPS